MPVSEYFQGKLGLRMEKKHFYIRVFKLNFTTINGYGYPVNTK